MVQDFESKVQEQLGRGSYGTVYKAKSKHLGVVVALKEVSHSRFACTTSGAVQALTDGFGSPNTEHGIMVEASRVTKQ